MMSYAKKVTGMLQDYYAERLEVAYILHINWFFRLMYGIFKPFLSKKTRDKNRNREIRKIKDKTKVF